MRHLITAAVVTALLSAPALAQTTSAPGQYPGLATLKAYVAQGLSVALASSDGRLVAVVNADGTITVAKGANLSEATVAIVKSEAGKALVALQLAAEVASNGVVWVEEKAASGQVVKVPITASAGFKGVYSAQVSAKSQTTGAAASSNGLTNTNATTGAEKSSVGISTAVEVSTTVPTAPVTVSAPTLPVTPPAGPAQR